MENQKKTEIYKTVACVIVLLFLSLLIYFGNRWSVHGQMSGEASTTFGILWLIFAISFVVILINHLRGIVKFFSTVVSAFLLCILTYYYNDRQVTPIIYIVIFSIVFYFIFKKHNTKPNSKFLV